MNFEELKKEIYNDSIGMGSIKILLSRNSKVLARIIINDNELLEEFFFRNLSIIKKCDRIDFGYAKNEDDLIYIKDYKNYFINDNGNTFTQIK